MVELMFNKELSDIAFDVEALDEWKATAKELGMEGQLKLSTGDNSPVPYPFMNEGMERVYETLCPNKTEFKAYKNTTIPLEVMKQIAFSVKEKHFDRIEIWADDKAPDPLVVGFNSKWYNNTVDENQRTVYFDSKEECIAQPENEDRAYESETKKYIVARWGDELRDFNELKSLAFDRLVTQVGGELERSIATKSEKLTLLKKNVQSYINGVISKYELEGSY
jgi:hypothetical protein